MIKSGGIGRAATKKLKEDEKRVSAIYKQRCSGIQIDIFDMSKIMRVGIEAVAEGLDDQAVGDKIRAFVESIRRN